MYWVSMLVVQLLQDLPLLQQQYDRIQWYYTPYVDTPPGNGNATLLIRANTSAAITGCWTPGPTNSGAPVTAPPHVWGSWPAGTQHCVDVSYKTMTHNGDDVQKYTEMEMMIPVEKHIDAMANFLVFQHTVANQHNMSVQLFTGVRYVNGDDITLSPFFARNTAVISMIVFGNDTVGGNLQDVQLYDGGLEDIAFNGYQARPHPGKMNFFNATMMRQVYGANFDQFVALARSVDPAGRFVNDYIANLLGL